MSALAASDQQVTRTPVVSSGMSASSSSPLLCATGSGTNTKSLSLLSLPLPSFSSSSTLCGNATLGPAVVFAAAFLRESTRRWSSAGPDGHGASGGGDWLSLLLFCCCCCCCCWCCCTCDFSSGVTIHGPANATGAGAILHGSNNNESSERDGEEGSNSAMAPNQPAAFVEKKQIKMQKMAQRVCLVQKQGARLW